MNAAIPGGGFAENASMSAIVLGKGDALLIVDMQNDFLPGGSLAVPRGDLVIEPINALIDLYREQRLPIYASRDWHPGQHCSFAAQGGPWPPHCVADTIGAAFSAALRLPRDAIVVSKAVLEAEDAYSAFNGTGLARSMRAEGITRLAVCGLATDYCVLNTVLDGIEAGFEVLLPLEGMRAVEVTPGDGDRAVARMLGQGAVPVSVSGGHLIADPRMGARL
ncbi:isochorismatase family protein [Massilia sp. IC2-476]|uniref:isochorismatase family protein n=1 Tax=Massilia sp. IC2-476 TaxID=2887199 RepID=UPI001D12C46E|nr:isochorismatase family protein [Massilia sp. IC2-476]MCC2974474.1 isochorismatase family protein [Massilia sp. IC2-476]